jgi:hypothetical protein
MSGGLPRRRTGPRRTESVASYRPATRILAFLALLACGAAVVSDHANESFWERHALLASLAASVIVVILTVTVVNEVLERRSRQRWSILAQYVMLELIRNARMIWSGILDVAFYWLLLEPHRTRPAPPAGVLILRRDGKPTRVDTPLTSKLLDEARQIVSEIRTARKKGVTPRVR